MITFLDENDVEYGALATIKATNAVNGERSLTGTIVSGEYVLSKIERGWRLRFDDEYYVVTYAKPVDEGKNVQVSFDAVHQFFWDFGKSSVYDQLSDGSHTFRAYLDFIFDGSGYRYDIESSLTVKAFEKQSFGYKNRLSLFNDIITSSGVEFQVNGKVVRILAKVGTDLSTVVRKNFNLNELGIEKNIGDFVTYQKGFGAYFDEEDHSKGRLIAEYTSPLASVYGKLEADPLVDERYKQSESLLNALKETVDNSYTISVSLDMEDLTRAGYRYTQPVAGDYIMAINETLGFKEKIRIVSFTSEYDVAGQLIKHTVTCNDIGSVKKLSASYTQTQHQAANAEVNANTAYEYANKALISADGKNTNYYGDTFPVDNPKGTLKKGDLLFLTVGDTVKQYYWNGADWVINPVLDDVEAFKEHIAEELKDVPNREEFENKISEEIATSKAEITTQIESAKTQAESNAKEYADTINQETAKVAELANAAAGEIKADLVNVKNNLTSTSLVANNAQAAVDAAKQELTEVASELNTAKQDLANSVTQVNAKVDSTKAELTQAKQDLVSQAQQLQTQASAQAELTKRVTTVETTANGTKTTVNELTKTVAQNGKDITSVTNRTKTVEDDLANTKTTLTQVQTTANSASQKTATLESGLNGLSAKFNSLSVGNKNYLPTSRVVNRGCSNFNYSNTTKSWTMTAPASSSLFGNGITFNTKGLNILLNGGETLFFGLMIKANKACSFNYDVNNALSGTTSNDNDNDDRSKRAHSPSNKSIPANVWTRVWFSYTAKANVAITENNSKFGIVNNTEPVTIEIKEVMVAKSNVPVDYQAPDADLEQKVAEYKQNADQNYASLQTTVQNLDGTVKQNKSEFDQTASQLRTSISSVEGRIPTNVSTRNLILKSNDFANPHKQNGANTTVTSTGDYFIIKSTGYTADAWGGMSWNISISEVKAGEQFSILMPVYIDSSVNLDNGWGFSLKNHSSNSAAYNYDIPTNKKDQWFNISITFKAVKDVAFDGHPFYVFITKNGLVRIKPPMLVRGNLIPSDYQPAFEDTESDVTKLNTTLTQTADGLKQLSTKVTSQGNTITSHTNSINSLNTGLQAKVSQTDFNTLSGRVTTAENNITAKANELSSKITSVEGKIPTSIGARNYIRNYGLTATGWRNTNAAWKIEIIKDSTAKSGQYLKATCTTASTNGGGFYKNLFDFSDGRFFGKQMTWAMDIKLSKAKSVKIGPEWGYAYIDITATTEWKRYSKTFTVATTTEYNNWIFYTNDKNWNVGDIVYIRDVQLEDGSIATSPVPAIEDTESDITKLNTTLTQTADGLKQLSTQVTSQGNTINTHTTQISALNTGLQAKVSQSDFNTLSGRVTNAENSITAKANELSSKISSVEGKIPTNLDSLNLMTGTRDWSTKANKWHMGANWSTENVEYQGLKVHSTKNGFNGSHQNIFVKNGDVITFSFFAKATNTLSKIKVSSRWPDSSVYQAPLAGVRESDEEITITSEWKRYSKTVHITSDGSLQFRAEYNDATIPNGNTFYVAGLKLAKTSQDTGYSENLADVASDISGIAGKIPTSVWVRNYALKTGDSKSTTAGIKLYDLSSAFDGIADDATLIIEFDWRVTAPTSTSKFRINRVIKYSDGTAEQWNDTIVKDGVYTDVSSSSGSGHYSGTFTKVPYNGQTVSSRYLYLNQTTANGTVTISNLSVRVGSLKSDWQPAPEDAISQINSVSSEFKQTTDAIKASVASLDGSTVKNSSLTINADGIVMKAGKSTTDVANAIGSYFAVNQNAINLFSDKINVKGNMIVNGAITSDKIASKSINTAHLNGKIITADVISSNAVTADAIKAGAVTTDKMSANSINGDRIAAGTLDAAKIKAGSITASQIASGTITSNQIKAGGISSANIAAGAITGDKIAAGAIDANKIAANAITANMIRGGQLKSTNGATSFDLNAGTLTFNNDYGYIQRVASDKVFEITTVLGKNAESQDFLTSDFTIRKSDFSRQAGAKFTLYNATADKPTARATIHADELVLFDSQNTTLLSILAKGSLSNFNFQGWGDIPVAQLPSCGLMVKDIGIGGYTKSLQKIVEELCRKTGVLWI